MNGEPGDEGCLGSQTQEQPCNLQACLEPTACNFECFELIKFSLLLITALKQYTQAMQSVSVAMILQFVLLQSLRFDTDTVIGSWLGWLSFSFAWVGDSY